jgi:hypothetical protein
MSMRMFTAPVTFLNLAGYTVAFLGVCWYNYTKLSAAKAKVTKPAGGATGKADEEAPGSPVDTTKEPGQESKGTQ